MMNRRGFLGSILAAAVVPFIGMADRSYSYFTKIPWAAKRITVRFTGISGSGNSSVTIQIGDSGGIETSGYKVIDKLTIRPSDADTFDPGPVMIRYGRR